MTRDLSQYDDLTEWHADHLRTTGIPRAAAAARALDAQLARVDGRTWIAREGANA